jgi:hypothetical protein
MGGAGGRGGVSDDDSGCKAVAESHCCGLGGVGACGAAGWAGGEAAVAHCLGDGDGGLSRADAGAGDASAGARRSDWVAAGGCTRGYLRDWSHWRRPSMSRRSSRRRIGDVADHRGRDVSAGAMARRQPGRVPGCSRVAAHRRAVRYKSGLRSSARIRRRLDPGGCCCARDVGRCRAVGCRRGHSGRRCGVVAGVAGRMRLGR